MSQATQDSVCQGIPGVAGRIARTNSNNVYCGGVSRLGASELVGLQWGDFDWKACEVHIQRGVVIGRVDEVKTTNSNRRLPVHPNLADLLAAYKAETAPGAGN